MADTFRSFDHRQILLSDLLISSCFREDKLETLSLSLKREFDAGKLSYAKFGFRVRDRNKDRWSFDPDDGVDGCNGDPTCETLATSSDWLDFDRVTPTSGNFTYSLHGSFARRRDAAVAHKER